MKNNYGFVPISVPLFGQEEENSSELSQDRRRLFMQEYDWESDDIDSKVRGERAHIAAEYCRLERLASQCTIGHYTDLKKGIITKEDLDILENQKNKAFHLSQFF